MDSQERDKAVMPNVVSYVAFESVQARNERHIKRLWITNLVLIALLFLSNAIWLWFYSGFDFESYDYEQDIQSVVIRGTLTIAAVCLTTVAITAMIIAMTVHTHAGAVQTQNVIVWDGTARSVDILAATAGIMKN